MGLYFKLSIWTAVVLYGATSYPATGPTKIVKYSMQGLQVCAGQAERFIDESNPTLTHLPFMPCLGSLLLL